eukprot:TRINITY_DN7133_c0_g3_i1.p1 TRINITY_DN7133_c0_g3~~TRINITY_DN7133_c0_g3_i1.p1  ORF type:complete len:797 (-),score=125.57 TRINITY_DN7133_c0_g3_i1:213-2603(-)
MAASPTSRLVSPWITSTKNGKHAGKDLFSQHGRKNKGAEATEIEQMLTKTRARHQALQTGFNDQLRKAISQELLKEVLALWQKSRIWIRSAINSLEAAADIMFKRHAQRRVRVAMQSWRSTFTKALHESHNGEKMKRQLDLARRTSARLWRLKNVSGLSLCAATFQAMVRLHEAAVHKREVTAKVSKIEKRCNRVKTWLEGHITKTDTSDHHRALCLTLQAWHQLCDLSKRDVVMMSREFEMKQKVAVALNKSCWRQLLPRFFRIWLVACNCGRSRSLQRKHGRLLEQLDSLLEHADTLHDTNEVVTATTFNAWAHHGDVVKRRIQDPFPGSFSRMSFWERLMNKMTRDDDYISVQKTFQTWARGISCDRQQRAQQECQQAVQSFEEQKTAAERKIQQQTAQMQRLQALLGECMRGRRAEAAPFASVSPRSATMSPRNTKLREDWGSGSLSPKPSPRVADGRPPAPMSPEVPPLDTRRPREDREFALAPTLPEVPPLLDTRRPREVHGFAPAPTSWEVPEVPHLDLSRREDRDTEPLSPDIPHWDSRRGHSADVGEYYGILASHRSGADGLAFQATTAPLVPSSLAKVSASASPSPLSPPSAWPPSCTMSPFGSAQTLAPPGAASVTQPVFQPLAAEAPPSPCQTSKWRLVATESSAASCAGQLCFASPLGVSSPPTTVSRGHLTSPAASPVAVSGQQPRSPHLAGGNGDGSGEHSSGRSVRMDVKDGRRSSAPSLVGELSAAKGAGMRGGDGEQGRRTPPPPLTSDRAAAGRLTHAPRRLSAPTPGSLVISRLSG